MVGRGGRLGRLYGWRRDGRMRSPGGGLLLPEPGCARVRESPADEGPAGPFNGEPYSVGFSSLASEFSSGFAGSLT